MSSKVLAIGSEGNVSYYVLSKPYNENKIQRREFYRVQISKNIEYKLQNEDEFKYGITVDISASGMQIKCNDEIENNSIIIIKVLVEDKMLLLKGQVVRKVESGDLNNYGVHFIDIKESEQDLIVKEVLRESIKQRKIV